MVKKFLPIIFVIVLSFVAGLSLLHKGLIPTHDAEYHIIRFYEFDKTIRDGDFYPRWAPDLNNGYGVPLFNYVYPLPNYAASFLHLFSISFIDSFRLIMFGSFLFGGIFFYLWSRRYWGESGGVAASAFYIFSPYHFVDTYIRGSIGEVMALAIFPALLWSYERYLEKRERKFMTISSLFLTLLIFAHNILALLFFTFFIIYASFILYRKKLQRDLMLRTLCIVMLGLGMSAIFWLPALLEKGYVIGLQIFDVHNNFVQIYELLIPSWGSGIFGDLKNQMSVQIGAANIIAVLFVILLLVFSKKKKNINFPTILFFVLTFFLSSFMTLAYSSVVWDAIPLFNYFQFPWRFLSLIILAASFLAGSIPAFFNRRTGIIVSVLMVSFVVATTFNYTKPAYYHQRDDAHYTSRSNFIDGTNSPGNLFNTKWLNSIPPKKSEKLEFLKGSGTITQIISKTARHKFDIKANSAGELLFNNAYFPGWSVFVDEEKIEIKEKNGLIVFPIESGGHTVEVVLVSTGYQVIGGAMSITSLIILLIVASIGIIKKDNSQ